MRHVRHSQLGVALILILTMIIVGAASMILYKLNHVNFQATNQDKTAQALAQAKDALLGFAMTYAENHPDNHSGQPQGYLPCPDKDGDGTAATACGGLGESVLGRLPWKTLGLPVLRDGSGECLWYAVSGTYKDNPKHRTFTSDTDGLFVVKDATGVITIAGAGTTPAEQATDQAIAIIFAPGQMIGTQSRSGATGTKTVCGRDGAGNDAINQVNNYLDSDNATGGNTLIADLSTGTNNVLWRTTAALKTSQFVSTPLTKAPNDSSQVLFNDTLMLITPKDFGPVYKRMNRWVANQVERCLVKYSDQYQNTLPVTYENVIGKRDTSTPTSGTYRDTHKNEIEKYIADQLTDQLDKYIEKYKDQHDGQAPSTQQIEAEKQAEATKEATNHTIRKKAVIFTDKYPWASPLNNTTSPDYLDVSGKRFGRIPAAPLTNTHSSNPDMPDSWPVYSPPGIPDALSFDSDCGVPRCFDENQSSMCSGGKYKAWYWWWWDEWKEMVFYAVDDDYSPSTITKMWVREQTSTAEVLTSPIPLGTLTNTLKLDSDKAQIVVLVAGRKSSTPIPTPPPTSTQTRDSIDPDTANAAKGNAWNYLEGGNEIVGNEHFVSKQPTPIPIPPPIRFNDVVCSDNTCPLP